MLLKRSEAEMSVIYQRELGTSMENAQVSVEGWMDGVVIITFLLLIPCFRDMAWFCVRHTILTRARDLVQFGSYQRLLDHRQLPSMCTMYDGKPVIYQGGWAGRG